MSLLITDNNLGIEVKNASVKIGYFTVNRTGFFEESGKPMFSANLFLEYSNGTDIYFRKCISIDYLLEEECNFAYLYTAMKHNTIEFENAEDSIPVYKPITKPEPIIEPTPEPQVIPEIIPEMPTEPVPTV